eukprot:3363523-Rhodomonas_salina.1
MGAMGPTELRGNGDHAVCSDDHVDVGVRFSAVATPLRVFLGSSPGSGLGVVLVASLLAAYHR